MDLAYRAWRMSVVRGFLMVCLLGLTYWVGTLVAGGDAVGHGAHAGGGSGGATAAQDEVRYWTCSMHPNVKLPAPGLCPICFMDLIPVKAGAAEDESAPVMSLSPRARTLARIETAEVKRRELAIEIQMVGKVAADETRITYISSYIPGRLDRLYVNYTGILVRKGDHLAEIYSPELLVAQTEYVAALDAADRGATATQAFGPQDPMIHSARRKLELWGISKDVLDTLARERKPSDHIRIDSPVEGWVLERMGYEGMYVDTGMRIFTLADLRHLWVMLDAYELDIGYLRLAQEVEFETEAFRGQLFHGRIAYIDPVLRADTRTVKVRVNVTNPDLRLRPEMFVRAHVHVRVGEGGRVIDNALAGKWICPMHPEVAKREEGTCDICGMRLEPAESLGFVDEAGPVRDALAVPQTAVLLTGKRAVVYVEKKDGEEVRYEGRVIRVGPRAGNYYIVEEGLSEGERVVTHGALMIDSALQIQARPSMMQTGEKEVEEESPAKAEEPPIVSRYVRDAMYHQHVAPIVEAYVELVNALAADDAEGAAAAAKRLRAARAQALPHGVEGDEAIGAFNSQITAIESGLPAEGADIEGIRAKLPDLTRGLETYLRTFGHNRSGPLFEAYCPMAFDNQGASWLQAEERISNPYFGSKMLRCGEIRKRIAKDGRVVHE